MAPLLEVARTGLAAVLLHPLRSLVSFGAVVAVLLPYLAGTALSKGLEAEAEASALAGADLYVSVSQFGRPVPIPRDAVAQISRIEGVNTVVPRIVGEVSLGREHVPAVLVGLAPDHFTVASDSVEGELPRPGEPIQLVVGTALARQLQFNVGSLLPPFYRNNRGEHVSRVVGVFKSDAPMWQSHLILTPIDAAAEVFDQPGLVTDLLVWCRPGYQQSVSRKIVQDLSFPGPAGQGTVRGRVTGRDELLALLPRGTLHREGVFTLHFVLAFVVGGLVLLVTSGLGLAERRREIGILKATGWQTDEVLLRGATESLCLSLAGASSAQLLAWAWLRLFNGYGLAGYFLAGATASPAFVVPCQMTPVPALLAFVLSIAVVLTGTLYSSWRAATTAPREAMR